MEVVGGHTSEHGALMAANILNSPRAVAMSVYVIRAFVKMREEVAANAAILRRLTEWNMCPDLEQRRFGASRVASPPPTAATGPGETAMCNHGGFPTGSVDSEDRHRHGASVAAQKALS
jgi:hypothetical protein